MKLSTSITVVALTLGVAFFAYSTRDQETFPTPLQANIVKSLPEEPDAAEAPENPKPVAEVEITSTRGLDEEFSSILEGYAEIQSDFDRLEPEKTATGASN